MNQTIKDFAALHSVSTRTAGRYIKAGKLPPPPESRKQGRDGKLYPCGRGNTSRSTLYLRLMTARSAARAVAKVKTLSDDDLKLLKEIVFLSTRTLETVEYFRQRQQH